VVKLARIIDNNGASLSLGVKDKQAVEVPDDSEVVGAVCEQDAVASRKKISQVVRGVQVMHPDGYMLGGCDPLGHEERIV
jgi:hypothetical protein